MNTISDKNERRRLQKSSSTACCASWLCCRWQLAITRPRTKAATRQRGAYCTIWANFEGAETLLVVTLLSSKLLELMSA